MQGKFPEGDKFRRQVLLLLGTVAVVLVFFFAALSLHQLIQRPNFIDALSLAFCLVFAVFLANGYLTVLSAGMDPAKTSRLSLRGRTQISWNENPALKNEVSRLVVTSHGKKVVFLKFLYKNGEDLLARAIECRDAAVRAATR